MKWRNETLLFITFTIALYIAIFHRLLSAPYFSMIDLEPPPPKISPPSLIDWYDYGSISPIGLGSYLYYYLSLMIEPWTLTKILTFIPFPVGTISFYYVSRKFLYNIKNKYMKYITMYILPFLYILNPGVSQIFYTGDSASIVLVYSFMPLVYYLSFKIYRTGNLYDFILLSILVSFLNILYYQAFYYAFIFEFPIILVMLVSFQKKYIKRILLLVLADSLAFFSNISQEIVFQIFVVPSLQQSSSSFGLFFVASPSTFLLILIFIVLVLLGLYESNKMLYSIIITIGSLLFIFAYYSLNHINIPLIGSILLSLTTFQSKIYMFNIGLSSIALVNVRKRASLTLMLLIIFLGVFLPPIAYSPMTNTYALLSFNPKPMEVNYTNFELLYNYLIKHDPQYTALYYPHPLVYKAPHITSFTSMIPVISQNLFYGFNLSEYNLTQNGIKYVVTTSPLNFSFLKLVYNLSDKYFIYYNKGYKGISFFPNGTPAKIEIKGNRIIGEKGAIVLIYYSKYWTNATRYNNFILLTGNVAQLTYYYIQNILMMIDIVSLSIPIMIFIITRFFKKK